MSTTSKILAAAICAASVSFAFAQGVPPRPATNAAIGAGQRSPEGTPMGTTGTPGGNGAAAQGSSAGSTAATSAASTGTSMSSGTGSSMNSGAMASNSGSMAGGTHHAKKSKKHKHVAKADRN
ncbi:proteophosphoglycan ppg4 [Ramlibacter sp.]|jgi:histone-lysine N-methyltransferase MLL1|uniref:proteophosphoglycan ppg4 n=1 Tax=Ramlibacter sp. TaxID=1917967 RepID=UPI0026185259|nr:proteophosphoglycan ppg4 [Ramlibacter sp.]MDB5955092.1 hypothetical protein [Ramlibacter sp.]